MRLVAIVCMAFLLAACANTAKNSEHPQWDFDHNVQFQQKDLGDNRYYIKVVSTSKTRFSQLATFLMRKSLHICQSYGFKIEVLEGVEGFNDRRSFPNLIMDSLAANVECKS